MFHRIDDPGEMEFAVFCQLAYRLPAYAGAMAAVAAQQQAGQQPARGRQGPRYERTDPQAGKARTADSAPPATAGALAGLNAQLGGQWFSVRTATPGGGD